MKRAFQICAVAGVLGLATAMSAAAQVRTSDVLGCQKGFGKAGDQFMVKAAKGIMKCIDGLLKPHVLKEREGDPEGKFSKDFGRALDKCDEHIDKIFNATRGEEKKKIERIVKNCAKPGKEVPLPIILSTAGGPGFDNIRQICMAEHGIDIQSLDDVIECIDVEIEWFAARLASKLKPRACEMVDAALAAPQNPPDPRKKNLRPNSLEDSTIEDLTRLREHMICPPGPTTTSASEPG